MGIVHKTILIIIVLGAVSGVVKIGQGVAAVPQQIMAPRQGKWWNEVEGRWVLTNLPTDAATLLKDGAVPEDDADILGDIQQELDAGASKEFGLPKTVKDMYYYDQLEVDADADQPTIKRKYYLLARQYHPDKHPGDDEAAEKFKAIAEAYQVLSDPELRKRYNEDGKSGLSPDKTDVAAGGQPQVDSKILFAFLFGSDQFADITGPLATATSASIGDSPKVSVQDARKLQKRRVMRLAMKLVQRIDPYVQQRDTSSEESASLAMSTVWAAQAEELSKASFGHQLVTTIGQIYNVMAIMYEGSLDNGQGLPSISQWAKARRADLDKRNAANSNKLKTLQHGMTMMKLQQEMQQKMQRAETEEEKRKIAKEHEEGALEIMLQILWTTTVVDLTSTLHEVCHMVFYDQAVDKTKRKHRAEAIRILG
jgi:curved DNA-binding protein CbpA